MVKGSAWALGKAADHLFGDNLPSGAEPHIERLAALLDDLRAEVLREALDAIPRTICAREGEGCDRVHCPLRVVNVAISALLDK